MYLNRWNPIEDMLNIQRQADRIFNQFWADLPEIARTAGPSWSSSLLVHTRDDAWQIDMPIPGIDPQHVAIETAGGTLTIRAEQPADGTATRFEQSFAMPPFLDVEKASAAYRHGMLQLTLPLKDSVKPRRIQIEGMTDDRKQLVAV